MSVHDGGVQWYAALGQDRVIAALFDYQHGGYFVDVGAAGNSSNTRALERALSWRGLCIERDAAVLESLARHRTACTLVGAVVDNEVGNDVDDLGKNSHASDFARLAHNTTRVPAVISRERLPVGGHPSKVRTTNLPAILRQYRAPERIDYLSLGLDSAVAEERALMPLLLEAHHKFGSLTFTRPVGAKLETRLGRSGYIHVENVRFGGGSLWVQESMRADAKTRARQPQQMVLMGVD